MSIESPVTIVLANRPRLFRELLQHALKTRSSRFNVVEAADTMPAPSVLHNADWLVVDEEAAFDVAKLANAHPQLNILALESRGSRARVLAPTQRATQDGLNDVPTLSQLFDLLEQEAMVSRTNSAS